MKHRSPQEKNSWPTCIKPLEIYLFIDPFCTECWSLSPIITRLQMEYGDYFTIKYVLCGNLSSLNRKNGHDIRHYNHWKQIALKRNISYRDSQSLDEFSPHLTAISIKAAELQGKRAGVHFIRRLQEMFFMENADITDVNVLQRCAKHVGLDVEEFIHDIYSSSAAKAFQCDLKISIEMEVTDMPAMVFFNENIEDEGLKISGIYSYRIYVQLLNEMLESYPQPAEKPPLEQFLTSNPIVATQDLAVIYDQSSPTH